jgi:hypothetical protein
MRMKKFLFLFIIPVFLMGCPPYRGESSIEVKFPSPKTKNIADPSPPSPLEIKSPVEVIDDALWAGNHSLYRFVDRENGYIVYFNQNSMRVVSINGK